MISTQAPRRARAALGKRARPALVEVDPRARALREVLGKAHYERMRAAMAPTLVLDPWAELSEATRETYRARLDYAVPALIELLHTDPRGMAWQT